MRATWVRSLAAALLAGALAGAAAAETLEFGRFGTVTIYRQTPAPAHLVLFVSGDGGWNLGVVDMARALAALDAVVVGIDIVRYERALAAASDECSDVATDLADLARFVVERTGFGGAPAPILVGYSSGATLVYAALVEAAPETFRGAISLGFCPDLELAKPLCRGRGLEWKPMPKGKGYVFEPATTLQAPWIAFQGTIDQVCDAAATEAYVKRVPRGEIVLLPKVGHGYSVLRNWMPQFKTAFARVAGAVAGPGAR
jgi:type IV secretory pathway VirJ component